MLSLGLTTAQFIILLFDTLFLSLGKGVIQISRNTAGLWAWSLETCVAVRVVCCLSWLGTVSELFEGRL